MEITIFNDPVKQTFELFKKSGFEYGDVIPKEWFMKNFRLDPPKTADEMNRVNVIYMNFMGELRAILLTENKMALRSKPGIGQEIVKPKEQTAWAVNEVKRSIAKELERARDRVYNIDYTFLSESERQENSDAVAKLSFFANKSMKALTW